jgi:BirA family biotin operon repressor/biotin-[acetyl-CoA-carboxylase] ligase
MEPVNVIEIKQVDSTNKKLKKFIAEDDLPEGFVVLAEKQTQGKGMGKNSWESEPGKNLTFSLLLRPSFLEAENMFLISKVVSLGIIDYLNSIDECFTIKWPNDIYYCNKKVGGILIENQIQGSTINYSVIGIGLNVNQEIFTSDAPNPISLKTIFGKSFNTKECLQNLTNQIGIWYDMLADGFIDNINQRYFDHLFHHKEYHDFKANNELFVAKIKHVENDGQLILKTAQGEIRKFYIKEVEFVL